MTDSLIVTYIYILLLYTYVTISLDSFIDSLIVISDNALINYQTITINPPLCLIAEIVTTQKCLKAVLIPQIRGRGPLLCICMACYAKMLVIKGDMRSQ